MRLIGITGGIGMGKSTCAAWLEEQGVPLVDTDHLARQLTGEDDGVLADIRSHFGERVITEQGELDRRSLAEIVFSHADSRRVLEGILHPRIRRKWTGVAESWRASSARLGVVVIPLLYETSAESAFDDVLCVGCSSGTQRARLRKRGWTDEEISRRNAAQLSPREKIARSDFLVWTEGEISATHEQLKMVLPRLTK